jgi:Iron-containing redox enzyme
MHPTRERGFSASDRLRRKVGLGIPALVSAGNRLIAHSRVRELYPEYLFMSHCVIRASVPLMKAGRTQAAANAESDPVSAGLAPYLEQHIPEEQDHDEWLLDDLEMLGRPRSEVLARPPSPTVAALVGAQYYWIFHYHPVALLGHIACLEGHPPSPELIDELKAATGHGPDAFRTMVAHADLDPGHRDELYEVVDSLPLTREQSAVMGLSAIHTVHMYARAIEEILDEYREVA